MKHLQIGSSDKKIYIGSVGFFLIVSSVLLLGVFASFDSYKRETEDMCYRYDHYYKEWYPETQLLGHVRGTRYPLQHFKGNASEGNVMLKVRITLSPGDAIEGNKWKWKQLGVTFNLLTEEYRISLISPGPYEHAESLDVAYTRQGGGSVAWTLDPKRDLEDDAVYFHFTAMIERTPRYGGSTDSSIFIVDINIHSEWCAYWLPWTVHFDSRFFHIEEEVSPLES